MKLTFSVFCTNKEWKKKNEVFHFVNDFEQNFLIKQAIVATKNCKVTKGILFIFSVLSE